MQILIQTICTKGRSLREAIASDARIGRHDLEVVQQKRPGRQRGLAQRAQDLAALAHAGGGVQCDPRVAVDAVHEAVLLDQLLVGLAIGVGLAHRGDQRQRAHGGDQQVARDAVDAAMEQRQEQADADARPQAGRAQRLGAQVVAFAQGRLALVIGQLPGVPGAADPVLDHLLQFEFRILAARQWHQPDLAHHVADPAQLDVLLLHEVVVRELGIAGHR